MTLDEVELSTVQEFRQTLMEKVLMVRFIGFRGRITWCPFGPRRVGEESQASLTSGE